MLNYNAPPLTASSKVNYINGSWQAGLSADKQILIDPNDETSYGELYFASKEQIAAAIASAQKAFPSWSQMAKEQRARYLSPLPAIYEKEMRQMGQAICQEMGAPIDFAINSQARAGLENIEQFLTSFAEFTFSKYPSKLDNKARLMLQPLGVAALITPWNWPIHQITLKVIPALLAGCTVILKPSEIAPLSAILFGQMLEKLNLPAGVFNLIQGSGAEAGTMLSQSPFISMISFTGSTHAGKEIIKNSAPNLSKVTLELGGKGANILCEDRDNKAVKRAIISVMRNSGQSCNAPSRLLVPKSQYQAIKEEAYHIASAIKIDHSSKSGNHIGPLSHKKQYDKVMAIMAKAIKQGARLLCGAARPTNFNKGYFIAPSIFYDVTPSMEIFHEEIFGPVLTISAFADQEEAIALANNSRYGLTNYIQTQDREQAHYIAERLACGMVEINGNFLPGDSFFGGIKQSGNAREGGLSGIEEYCYSKMISRV